MDLQALALQRADEQMEGFTWDESSFHRLCFHLAEIAARSRASKVLHEAHETYTTHSQPEEDEE